MNLDEADRKALGEIARKQVRKELTAAGKSLPAEVQERKDGVSKLVEGMVAKRTIVAAYYGDELGGYYVTPEAESVLHYDHGVKTTQVKEGPDQHREKRFFIDKNGLKRAVGKANYAYLNAFIERAHLEPRLAAAHENLPEHIQQVPYQMNWVAQTQALQSGTSLHAERFTARAEDEARASQYDGR